jgi:hypothetical protein
VSITSLSKLANFWLDVVVYAEEVGGGRIFVSWQQAARIFGMASQNSRLQRMWNTRLRLGFPMPDLGELALLCCYSTFRPGAKALFTRATVFRKTLTAGQRNKLAGLLPREILLLRFLCYR